MPASFLRGCLNCEAETLPSRMGNGARSRRLGKVFRALHGRRKDHHSGEGEISTVFVEKCRESYGNYLSGENVNAIFRDRYRRMITMVAAHEMGHQPGDYSADHDHAEGSIMSAGVAETDNINFTSKFTGASIKRFRQCRQWSN